MSVDPLSLRARIVRGGGWVLAGHVAGQMLRLASNLVMTRLLVPEMFGIMIFAHLILVGIALLSDLGLNQGVIQSRHGSEPEYLNTVWVVQIGRGAIICACMLAIAYSLAQASARGWLPTGTVYSSRLLPYVVAWLSVNPLISGFASTKLALASRNLALGRLSAIELSSQALGIAAMIFWALVDRSVWALVAGAIFSNLCRVAMSHFWMPGKANAWKWDRACFADILSFGKWVFLTSIVGFVAMNGDRLILGGLVDPTTLGLYAIAFFIVGATQEVFNKLIVQVALPAFSKVARERPRELKSVYYKFRLPFDAAALFVLAILFNLGDLIIGLLYDKRYFGAGAMVSILSLSLFEARFKLAHECFVAMGMPQLKLPILLAQVLILVTFVPIIYNGFGLMGALWVIGTATCATLPITFYLKVRHGLMDWRKELLALPFFGVGYLFAIAIDQLIKSLSHAIY